MRALRRRTVTRAPGSPLPSVARIEPESVAGTDSDARPVAGSRARRTQVFSFMGAPSRCIERTPYGRAARSAGRGRGRPPGRQQGTMEVRGGGIAGAGPGRADRGRAPRRRAARRYRRRRVRIRRGGRRRKRSTVQGPPPGPGASSRQPDHDGPDEGSVSISPWQRPASQQAIFTGQWQPCFSAEGMAILARAARGRSSVAARTATSAPAQRRDLLFRMTSPFLGPVGRLRV